MMYFVSGQAFKYQVYTIYNATKDFIATSLCGKTIQTFLYSRLSLRVIWYYIQTN